ncbi:putative Adenine deaminase 2 [Blattamonas nauphoetae]|uniref:adenine deaminase n=1 Tax=Blattamonas nauphoetae TaxID=2049346 RepID=A0ABQ9YFE5_9EUKA|nr:putative Adenine deaminase 2 [Blattamonas nauphoetae]
METIESRVDVALGKEVADLILKNCQIVNVFTGKLVRADISIKSGRIAGIGKYDLGTEIIDLNGGYVSPGLINTHLHTESSMLAPEIYCQEEAAQGTTTIICDPHEMVNVGGKDALKWFLSKSDSFAINCFVQLPSCVPATNFETNGCPFTSEEMKEFLSHPNVLGLGEMMNYPGVLFKDSEVMAKLKLLDGRIIDGHAPGLSGPQLQGYLTAGIMTDHESTTFAEAKEKVENGQAVLIRQGSSCHNAYDIIKGILEENLDTDTFTFCTDDCQLADLRKHGTIRNHLKIAVSAGMDPVRAVKMATLNAARLFRLRSVGGIAPGYKADLVVFKDLKDFEIDSVFVAGKKFQRQSLPLEPSRIPPNSVHLPPLTAADLEVEKDGWKSDRIYPVVGLIGGQILTEHKTVKGSEVETRIKAGELLRIAVIERHHASGQIGRGLMSGYGLKEGAIGTTVAHDSHNLILAGTNTEDMLVAAKELEKIGGGYVLVKDGVVIGRMALPVYGLMTAKAPDEFLTELQSLLDLTISAGISTSHDAFLTLSFIALPVIPSIRLTDKGMFDVDKFELIQTA